MKSSTLVVFLLATINIGKLGAQYPTWEDTCNEYSNQIYDVPASDITISHLSSALAGVLKNVGQHPLIFLEFYRNGLNERRLRKIGAPGASEVGFAPTDKFLYPSVQLSKLYVGYAVQMSSDQTIAIRRGDVETVKQIVKHDAMHLDALGQTLEIVHIGFHRKAKYELKEGQCKGTPQIFASTEAQLTPELGLAAFRELRTRLSIDFVLLVRNDSWFWDWDEFPVLDPFHPLTGDPQTYDRRATLMCSKYQAAPPSCTVFPPRIPYVMEPPKIP
jgi:hypothetical protein